MNLTINGKATAVDGAMTLLHLLEQHGLTNERVAVECNGQIIAASAFPEHDLQDGDVLEIVRFVGGG